MAQIKVFNSAATGGDLDALADTVNAWLEAERPHITHFAQTTLLNDLILTFIFELATGDAQETLAEAADVPQIFEQSLDQAELDPTSDTPLLPEAELPY